MDVLGEIWRRALSIQPVPPPVVVIATALLAGVLVMARSAWPVTRQLVTISHEGGHALGALLTGRRLAGIRLHSDTSGVTLSRGRPRGPGMVIMLAGGYLAPAVAGVAAALLLASGRSLALLWLLALWLGAMLLQIRNPYGFLMVLGCGLGVGLVTWFLPGPAQSSIAYLITWVLLLAAPKPLLELRRQRQGRRGGTSDVDQLARVTPVPAFAWWGGFLIANLVGLAIGVAILVPSVTALGRSLIGS